MALTKLEAASGLHISLSLPSTSRYRLDYLSNCPDEYQIVNEDIHDHRRACRPTWRWILLFRDGCWVEKLKFRSMLGSSFTNFEKASWNLAKVRTLLGSIQLPSVARTIYMVDIGSRITVPLSRPTVVLPSKGCATRGCPSLHALFKDIIGCCGRIQGGQEPSEKGLSTWQPGWQFRGSAHANTSPMTAFWPSLDRKMKRCALLVRRNWRKGGGGGLCKFGELFTKQCAQ